MVGTHNTKAIQEGLTAAGITDPVQQLLNQSLSMTYWDYSESALLSFDLEYAMIDNHHRELNRRSSIFGLQFGGAFMLLILLFVVTPRNRIKRPVFILNIIGLVLCALRAIINMHASQSKWEDLYSRFSGDYQFVPEIEVNVTLFGTFLSLVLITVIQLSLVFQIRTIFFSSPSARNILCWIGIAIGFITTGLWIAKTTFEFRVTLWIIYEAKYVLIARLARISLTISILYFTALLTGKLGYTLWIQKRMSLTRFGPLQIVFVMSCQSMFIPAIFQIVEAVDSTRWTAMGSVAQAFIVFSLPLSAVWAASTQEITPPGNKSNKGRVIKDSIFSTVMASVTFKASGPECPNGLETSDSNEKTSDVVVEEKLGGGYSNQV